MANYFLLLYRKLGEREWRVTVRQSRQELQQLMQVVCASYWDTMGPFSVDEPLTLDGLMLLAKEIADTAEAFDSSFDDTDWKLNWFPGDGDIREHYATSRVGDSDEH